MRRLFSFVSLLAFLSAGLPHVAAAAPSNVGAGYFAGLHWRNIGPSRAGRVLAVTGVPGEPEHFYFGAVDGGVWETINAGRTWNPIFDNEPIASIGSIAIAPSDHHVIYVGSGEADMRSSISSGNGMYKSTDGGKTWSHIGLEDTKAIGRIIVDPRDANVAYIAALGHPYGPNEQRGVFKTTDGGQTWNKVLYVDASTGASYLAMNPKNPQELFATMWQTRRPPWNVYPPSSGPNSGIYKTTDGGKTWTHIAGHGLPTQFGRAGVAYAPSDPSRVYAIVDASRKDGGIYRSDDGGATWTHTDNESRIWQRGWYFGEITVDPKNPDVLYAMNTSTYKSVDGGKSFDAIKGAPGGDDYHSMWIDPNDSNRLIIGVDQGTIISLDGAKTWSSWYNQSTAQFYHLAVDNRYPYWLYGAQQDSGAIATPSRSNYARITFRDWQPLSTAGENGALAADPLHPGYIFGYGGAVTDQHLATGWELAVDPTLAHTDEEWRSTWSLPLVFSQKDPHALYFGHQKIFRTTDSGKTWKVISPDLSREHTATPANLDSVTAADDNGLQRHGVVYSIAPSPVDAHQVWAGTDDGLIWRTTDDGAHWKNVTPPALTEWSKVGTVDASHFDARTAFAAVDRHRLDDTKPYIYRTRDGGATWELIVNGIADGDFVNAVKEDPHKRGLLYAATEHGMYVSFDDGDHWQSLRLNMPVTSVRDIAFGGDDLDIATFGRGFWILDDITALRQIDDATLTQRSVLFAPATAYRSIRSGDTFGSEQGTPIPLDEAGFENPPTGAILDYYVSDAAGPVTLDVLMGGRVLRHFSSTDTPRPIDPKTLDIPTYWLTPPPVLSAQAGAHRWVWDLKALNDRGPTVPPGEYTVRLTADGVSHTQTLTVKHDPRIDVTDAALRDQYALAVKIGSAIEKINAARARAQAALKSGKLPADQAKIVREQVLGEAAAANPDVSVGVPSADVSSLRFLEGAFGNLYGAVESADAEPTPDAQTAFTKLDAKLTSILAKLGAIVP